VFGHRVREVSPRCLERSCKKSIDFVISSSEETELGFLQPWDVPEGLYRVTGRGVAYDDSEWVPLVLDDVEGRTPGQPWNAKSGPRC